MTTSNAVGFIIGAFLSSWFLAWVLASAIFGVKSIVWSAYGRNKKSL